jgi:hypothetical protein
MRSICNQLAGVLDAINIPKVTVRPIDFSECLARCCDNHSFYNLTQTLSRSWGMTGEVLWLGGLASITPIVSMGLSGNMVITCLDASLNVSTDTACHVNVCSPSQN